MMGEILKALLITTLAGSTLAAAVTLLKPLTKRIFGYNWHYYIWLAVLVVMILPVRFNVLSGENADIPIVRQAQTVQTNEISDAAPAQNAGAAEPQSAAQSKAALLGQIIRNRINIFGAVWFFGMIISLLISIIGYLRLARRICKNSAVISCPEIGHYTKRKITVRVCGGLSSPFMMGILMPSLVLPDKELTPRQFDNILLHETTHFKRNDILYKYLAALVRCVHWFNPIVYYVTRQINAECEISCDLSVVKDMTAEQRTDYVNTIISLLSANRPKSIPLTTGMTGSKKMLRRRFIMIKKKKSTSKIVSAISAIIAAVMLGTTVFASGCTAYNIYDKNESTLYISDEFGMSLEIPAV
ncbi:MAG: M56 family metallopeptidase [Oscillospiraceae bacterium]|nr:M56 family metallopeptidase [Oscillospiraceae bacterium]